MSGNPLDGLGADEAAALFHASTTDPQWVAARERAYAEAAEDGHAVTIERLASAYRSTDEFKIKRAREIIAQLGGHAIRLAAIDRKAVTAALEILTEDLGMGAPPVMYMAGESPNAWLREAAEVWAEFATEREVFAVLVAGLDRLSRCQAFSQKLSQRVLAEIWGRLQPEARRAFLARVDPGGNLRGRS